VHQDGFHYTIKNMILLPAIISALLFLSYYEYYWGGKKWRLL